MTLKNAIFAIIAAIIGTAAAIIIVFAYGPVIHVNAATTHRYRRPYHVLIGISPKKTLLFACHNKNFKVTHVYLFGGCKQERI